MHRKVKGLLSLILTFAMVTATVAPVSAEEPFGEQQPAEEQPILEAVEESEPGQEQNAADAGLIQQPVMAVEDFVPEQQVEESASGQEQNAANADFVTQPTAETNFATEDQQPTEEQIMIEAEPEEQTLEAEPALVSDSDLDYLYDNLTEEQKQFRVYAGTDISSVLTFMDNGITPGSANLDAQGGQIVKALLEIREGDFKFYMLSGWNVWKVDSNGDPEPEGIVAAVGSSLLSKAATEENFKQAVYLVNNGIGTNPVVECQKPILEPVWSCLNYVIPVYDKDGNDTGTTITVNAENYSDSLKVAFPTLEADAWKLIYNDTECRLNAASEIWTNETNGIRTIGRDFNEAQARIQAFVLQEGDAEFEQADWYEGYPKPAPVVSSATNGTDNITYYYKEAGADDSTYTTIEPGKAGAYTAKAVFAATELYQEVVKTADFTILPIQTVLQEGTAEFEQPGWHVGEEKPAPVVSSATNGTDNITYYYKVQGADDSTYTTTVPDQAGAYTAKAVFAATELYQEVIKTSDFEIVLNVVADETVPVISGVADGQIYYGDQTVTVTDENLHTVTVNGEAVAVSNNRADIVLEPSDEGYKIVAEDMAGNRTEYTVEVWETWVRDGITTNGKKKLRNAIGYKLGSGQWTIDGDDTVYQGGITFYAKNAGEYDFKKK